MACYVATVTAFRDLAIGGLRPWFFAWPSPFVLESGALTPLSARNAIRPTLFGVGLIILQAIWRPSGMSLLGACGAMFPSGEVAQGYAGAETVCPAVLKTPGSDDEINLSYSKRLRSEKRRVGTMGVSTGRYRWARDQYKQKN